MKLNPDVNHLDNYNQSALALCADLATDDGNHFKILNMLLEAKADINRGISPVEFALSAKTDKPNLRVINLLINHPDFKINAQIRDEKFTALHIAAEVGNTKAVELLLQHPGILLNVEDFLGNTPLMVACEEERIPIIKLILNHEKKTEKYPLTDEKNKQYCKTVTDPEIKSLLQFTEVKSEDLLELKKQFDLSPVCYQKIFSNKSSSNSVKYMQIIELLTANVKSKHQEIVNEIEQAEEKTTQPTSPRFFSASPKLEDKIKDCAQLYHSLLKIEKEMSRLPFLSEAIPKPLPVIVEFGSAKTLGQNRM